MASVIPIIIVALLITGGVGALFQFSKLRKGPESRGDADDHRLRALAQLVWSAFLLVHAVFLLAMSESREVPGGLSVAAAVGGAVTFLGALVSLASCISLERRSA